MSHVIAELRVLFHAVPRGVGRRELAQLGRRRQRFGRRECFVQELLGVLDLRPRTRLVSVVDEVDGVLLELDRVSQVPVDVVQRRRADVVAHPRGRGGRADEQRQRGEDGRRSQDAHARERTSRAAAGQADCRSTLARVARTTVDWVALGIVALAPFARDAARADRHGALARRARRGAYIGSRVAPHLLHGGSSSPWAALAGLAGAVAGALLGQALAGIAGSFVRGGLRLTPFRFLDSAGGLRARRGRRARARLGDRRDRAAHPRTDPVPAGGARSRSC